MGLTNRSKNKLNSKINWLFNLELCGPNVRLLGSTWLELTTYLYSRLEFPTLGHFR